MGLFKFQNYSAIKNAQDNPRVRATAVTENGFAFKVVDNHNTGSAIYKEAGVAFANAAEAKGDLWVAFNIVDKPEIDNYADYKVKVGEFIRSFNLNKLKGEIVELSSDLVVTAAASVAVGDKLIPCNATDNAATPMKWVKAAGGDTGYGVCLVVTAKTTFGTYTIDGAGVGFECKITSN